MTGTQVRVRLLGGFEVTVDGTPVPAGAWRRRSASALVKLLALQPGHRMLREQLTDVLWPDLLLDAAAPRLHAAAHYARAATGRPDVVVLASGTVSLFPDAEVTVDVDELDRAAAAAGRAPDPETAAGIADLYTGTLLPEDLYEPWTEEPRERLRQQHLRLLRAAGRYEELVAADPLDEEAQLLLVRSMIEQGERQPALQALDRMADVFRRELGAEPGPVAVTLRRAAQELPLEPTVPAQRARPSGPPEVVRAGSSLPPPRGRLVGRKADVAHVAALVRAQRLVTVTGPGGAGKSTLALAVARQLQAEEQSGNETDVVLAELAPVGAGEDVLRAVADAAGVQGRAALDVRALAASLGPRSVVLLLDNCEHLIDDAAALVDAVLDAGSQARVLATSREPLRVDGEVEHRIGSLGAEAAELFAERAAAAAGPGAAAAEDPRVVALCESLDGLPLAIELAAAQLRHLSLAELTDRLDERLTLLVGGRPRAGPRHSALGATIDWSYRLLSEDARVLLDTLGVFPASFDLDAVAAVSPAARRGEVTNLLGDLVAKSLVVHEPEHGRYRLLETIRLFASGRLDEAGRRPEVTELLRRHVVDRSTAMPRVRTWLSASTAARSRDDLDNVRLAFDTSLAAGETGDAVDVALGLSTLWRNAVSYTEGRRWVDRLLACDLSASDRLWTLVLAADVGLGSGDPRLMRDAAAEAAVLAERLDDVGATVVTGVYGAMARLVTPARALARLDGLVAQARAADEPGLERLASAFRVVALRMLGTTDGLDEEIRHLLESSGSEYDRYICIWVASLVALVDRDGPRLRELMDAQLVDLMGTGLRENWLTMYWGALSRIGTGDEYLLQLSRARQRAEQEGRRADADCVLALAYAAACREEWEHAAELAGAAGAALTRDTAGFLHHVLIRDQLVRPRLQPGTFESALARGAALDLRVVLEKHGL